MPTGDTSPEIQRLQDLAHDRMGPEGRVRLAFELSEMVRGLLLSGIRSRFPEHSETEVMKVFIREVHGIEIGIGP